MAKIFFTVSRKSHRLIEQFFVSDELVDLRNFFSFQYRGLSKITKYLFKKCA